MHRHSLLLVIWSIVGCMAFAVNELPVVEIKADRTIIYPQRMALTGEESLMDVLQMMPELMIAGYEDVIDNYNLRIDNCSMNGDTRLIISQMKAKDVAAIQVCDNTGVAKGSIGMNGVLDINMLRAQSLRGFAEGQACAGTDVGAIGTANVLYGSGATDVYANTSYRHNEGDEAYLTLHMTNRFDSRNRLLTYFTHQYLDRPAGTSRKVMGRARFFHTFNELGTELLLVGGYQHASDQASVSRLPLYTLELNTPFISRRLALMLGFEGDFLSTKQRHTDRSWEAFNNDVYLQLTYTLAKWRWSVGSRVMHYDYTLKEDDRSRRHHDTRDNSFMSMSYVPNAQHQLQVGYYRKYSNPALAPLFAGIATLSDEDWAVTRGLLDEMTIRQMKMAYAYSRRLLTVKAEASYYAIEGSENLLEMGASAYWNTRGLSLAGGANLYATKHGGHAAFRLAPTVSMPRDWQIGLQMVCYTRKSPKRQATGVPVYGCVMVQKLIGRHWLLGVEWHDMFDALHSRTAPMNRHAACVKAQYRF